MRSTIWDGPIGEPYDRSGGRVRFCDPVTAVVGGSALLGAATASDNGRRQANTAADAQRLQADQFAQTREDQAPWRAAGQTALNQIGQQQDYFGHQFNAADLKNGLSPNYDFQLSQGLGNARNQANASGGLLSGNTLQGLNRFAQDYAGNAYQQAFANYNDQRSGIYNRLASLAGLGQQSVGATGTLGAQSAANQGSLMAYGANAQSAANTGAANYLNNGVNSYIGYQNANRNTQPIGGYQDWGNNGVNVTTND